MDTCDVCGKEFPMSRACYHILHYIPIQSYAKESQLSEHVNIILGVTCSAECMNKLIFEKELKIIGDSHHIQLELGPYKELEDK